MLRVLSSIRQSILPITRSLSTAAPTSSTSVATPSESEQPVVDEIEAAANSKPLISQPYSNEAITALKLDQYPYYVEREWWKKGKRMTFWASWRQLRDVNRREVVQTTGAERMRLKALKENNILPQAIRDEAAENLHNMPKYSRPRLILNMCQFTGRQRGKIKPYRLNRHLFRKMADRSFLSGVQRAMW